MSNVQDYGTFIGNTGMWDSFNNGPGTIELSLPIHLLEMGEGIPSCLHFELPRTGDWGSEVLLVSWGNREFAVFLLSPVISKRTYQLFLLGAQRGNKIFAGSAALYGVPEDSDGHKFLVLPKALRGFRLDYARIPIHLNVQPFLYPRKEGQYVYRVKTSGYSFNCLDLTVNYRQAGSEDNIKLAFRKAGDPGLLDDNSVVIAHIEQNREEEEIFWSPVQHSDLPHVCTIDTKWNVTGSRNDDPDQQTSNRSWNRRRLKVHR